MTKDKITKLVKNLEPFFWGYRAEENKLKNDNLIR